MSNQTSKTAKSPKQSAKTTESKSISKDWLSKLKQQVNETLQILYKAEDDERLLPAIESAIRIINVQQDCICSLNAFRQSWRNKFDDARSQLVSLQQCVADLEKEVEKQCSLTMLSDKAFIAMHEVLDERIDKVAYMQSKSWLWRCLHHKQVKSALDALLALRSRDLQAK